MLIDTHGHVNFRAFKEDGDEVILRALRDNTWIIMPGSQYSTSKRAVEIAEGYERGVYAAIGLHPIHVGEQRKVEVLETQSEDAGAKQPWETFETRAEEFDYEAYKELISGSSKGKVVAVGEVGLDYYYFPKSKTRREEIKQKQKEILQKQMDLAGEFGLPVILHCRKAHEDLLELLTINHLRGVVHSYTGTAEQAQEFLELGLYVGFNGLIFKDVPALPDPKEVIASIPLERIVLETDSPYLVPPAAGQERNEPSFVRYVAEEIARIKKVSFEDVARATTENARVLFTLSVE
ncbi:MAG: TatD family hydrolase [Candidatus Wildermuthbacteria bacterium]|nr:TatD family hydrolase [Candidatus Wildermuthbacteria bacterium]